MNKKVCDWCDKEVGISEHGYALGEPANFVYTIKTSLTYYNPWRNDLPEAKEKSIHTVELCDACYNKHVKPMFGWSRELIVYPDVRVIGEALHRIHDKLNHEWNNPELKVSAKYSAYLKDLLKKIGIEPERLEDD